jgi:hypothetical protein
MIGYMEYNKLGSDGFTDRGRGRTAASVQTCPVCLCAVNSDGGRLPDGTVLTREEWVSTVCKKIKDDTVNGGYQAGCEALAYPPF